MCPPPVMTPYTHHSTGSVDLSTVTLGTGRAFVVGGSVLCPVGCLAAPLASTRCQWRPHKVWQTKLSLDVTKSPQSIPVENLCIEFSVTVLKSHHSLPGWKQHCCSVGQKSDVVARFSALSPLGQNQGVIRSLGARWRLWGRKMLPSYSGCWQNPAPPHKARSSQASSTHLLLLVLWSPILFSTTSW